MTPIAVLGAGSWGCALALYLARRGQTVRMWSIESDHIAEMQHDRINKRYLPEHPFPDTLLPTTTLQDSIENVDTILVAVPSEGFRSTLEMLKPLIKKSVRIVWATKGIDLASGQLLHTVALDVLGKDHPCAILSGPSFAAEVAAGLPTSVVIASQDIDFSNSLFQRFNSDIFRITLGTDMTGIEIGGVVKNVVAIATGISDGMGYQSNTRSALITEGLAEMIRLGTTCGGQLETFIGLAGLGDLVLTCTDNKSRNRRYGLALGQGKSSETAEREINQVIEGKRNAELVMQLANQHNVSMPLINMVWQIISGKYSAKEAMQEFLAR